MKIDRAVGSLLRTYDEEGCYPLLVTENNGTTVGIKMYTESRKARKER
jgi:hypothetical protein